MARFANLSRDATLLSASGSFPHLVGKLEDPDELLQIGIDFELVVVIGGGSANEDVWLAGRVENDLARALDPIALASRGAGVDVDPLAALSNALESRVVTPWDRPALPPSC